MSDFLLLVGAALFVAAGGFVSWLSDVGEARKAEAEARLIEAKNARAALASNTTEGRTDRG